MYFLFFFFKQKTAYEMRISDWSSDVCSSDLAAEAAAMVHEQIRNWREGRPVPPQPAALPPEVASGTDATHTAEAPRMAAARLEISPGPADAMPPKPGAAAGAGFEGQQAPIAGTGESQATHEAETQRTEEQ